MKNSLSIFDLKKNDVFKIIGFREDCTNFKNRLKDLGIKKGEIGQIINKPFFGPIEIDIENRKIALGRKISKKILVEKLECPIL